MATNTIGCSETKERKLTQQESLEIITSMIRRTRERYIGDGNIMLMWGYLTVGVSLLVWAMLVVTHNQAWNWLWFLIWIVGGTLTPVMARRRQREKGVKSYSDKVTSQLWLTVGFSAVAATFCCLGFLLIGGVDSWSMMLAFALVIVPMAEIAQGIVVRETSLIAGGAVGLGIGMFTLCCIAGRVSLNVLWFSPLFIVAFTAMMIVPEHILNRKARAEK